MAFDYGPLKGLKMNDLVFGKPGGELEQIQLGLGHASVQTTERDLGIKQDLVDAPNDGIKVRVAV